MLDAIILKETKFCKLMKINSVSADNFSLLIEHTSYKSIQGQIFTIWYIQRVLWFVSDLF